MIFHHYCLDFTYLLQIHVVGFTSFRANIVQYQRDAFVFNDLLKKYCLSGFIEGVAPVRLTPLFPEGGVTNIDQLVGASSADELSTHVICIPLGI